MQLLPCLLGVAATTALGIWVLAPLVALSLPLPLAARIYLQCELRRNGISRLIPRACVVEIAEVTSRAQASLAERLNWSLLLVKDRIFH